MTSARYAPGQRLAWLNRQHGLTYAAFRVLAVMIENANDTTLECFPSKMRLERDLGLNKATVWRAVDSLVGMGLISDTGKRVGATKQVSVWRLNISANGCTDKTIGETLNGCTDETVSPMKPFHSGNRKGCTGAMERVSPTQQEQVKGTGKGTGERAAPSRSRTHASSSSSKKRTGTRMADDFTVPVDWLESVIGKQGWTKATADIEAQKFVAHYTVGKGMNEEWADWEKAWAKWCGQPFAGQTCKQSTSAVDSDPNATRGRLFVGGRFIDG